MVPEVKDAYIAALCASGQELAYKKYAGQGPSGVVTDGSALLEDLIEWTKARIAGDSAETNGSALPRALLYCSG
ncbi:hypothetical protein ACX80D_09570 [Arthrobacter sp. Sr24]